MATAMVPAIDTGNASPSCAGIAPITTTSRASASRTSRSSRASGGPVRLRLMMSTPCSIEWFRAFASVSELQRARRASSRRCQHALRASSVASGAIPTMPAALSVSAAMTPPTAVPCVSARNPCSSSSTKFLVASLLEARSGWVSSMPVSMIATRTPSPRDHRWEPMAWMERTPCCIDRYGSLYSRARGPKVWTICAVSIPGSRRSAATTTSRRPGSATSKTMQKTSIVASGQLATRVSPYRDCSRSRNAA